MKNLSIIVQAIWDDEAKVWVASSHDIDGLAVEAETMEMLQEKVTAAISDLLELNDKVSDLPEIPVYIMSNQLSRVPNPRF